MRVQATGRGGTLAHTSRFARLVVTENEFTSHDSESRWGTA